MNNSVTAKSALRYLIKHNPTHICASNLKTERVQSDYIFAQTVISEQDVSCRKKESILCRNGVITCLT